MTAIDLGDLWDHAPCGYVVATLDGRIVAVNSTLADWLGYEDDWLIGRVFTELVTVGGRIHYETHFAPLLQLTGELSGVTLDLVTAGGVRLPMLLTANVKHDADHRPELLRITVVNDAERRSHERELIDGRRRAETEQQRIRVFAETLRRSLLPPLLSPPPGLDAAEYYHAASVEDIGGDFYDLFPLSRETWGFFLGDVAGKGVDAAVVTGLTRYVLRSAAVSDGDPVRVLHVLNSVLRQHPGIGRNRMCTVIYGNVTRSDDGFDVELASGGHPPPILLGGDGSAYYADTVGGLAAGITDDARFVASNFHLAAGDTLILYTDGLTEAGTGFRSERFDDHGALLAFARTLAPIRAAAAVDRIQELLESLGEGVQDDTAVLALGVPPDVNPPS